MGQLPAPGVLPNSTFSVAGVDFAGSFMIQKGQTRKPTLTKAYLCIFCLPVYKSCPISPLNLKLLHWNDLSHVVVYHKDIFRQRY